MVLIIDEEAIDSLLNRGPVQPLASLEGFFNGLRQY